MTGRTTNHLLAFLLIALIATVAGCGQRLDPEQQAIADLEKEVERTGNEQQARELIKLYEAYTAAHPEAVDNNADYLVKAGYVENQLGRYNAAADFLRRALRDYPEAKEAAVIADGMADLYENRLEDTVSAQTIRQAMLARFDRLPDKAKLEQRLADEPPFTEKMKGLLGEIGRDTVTGRINFRPANQYLNSAELYAIVAPEAPENPTVLYKAAEVARAISMNERSLKLYQWIAERYPESPEGGKALFMKAFILDNDFNQIEEAREAYQAFIDRYPEDDFADDAQLLLDQLGKTPEEVLRQLEERQQ